MKMIDNMQLSKGVHNLLDNCARIRADETVLLVREDSRLGWYDEQAPLAVLSELQQRGIQTTEYLIEQFDEQADPQLNALCDAHDCTLFFARAGDQNRFAPAKPGQRSVVSYARNACALASAFGSTHHAAFSALKQTINTLLFTATEIQISCPLGTDYRGKLPGAPDKEPDDVSIRRFPLGIHAPLDGRYFSGRIALTKYLTATGSRVYQPDHLALPQTVFAEITAGAIKAFHGDKDTVAAVQRHYEYVAGLFGLSPYYVNSWHAGIHPVRPYQHPPEANPDLWSNSLFMHPSLVHFHTCGYQPPGEICWNVLNPTITVDGVVLWHEGALKLGHFQATQQCLDEWEDLQRCFGYARQ